MRKTRAIIHLGNLRHNLRVIANLCPQSKLCLAVKADAYGHGAVPVARAALLEGVSALGVATAEEAIELRAAGITAPIILYGIPAQDELAALISQQIELFCTDRELMEAIAQSAAMQHKQAAVHLKVDTGMGRIGCRPEEALELVRLAASSQLAPSIRIAGTCTHLPLSEDSNKDYTDTQIARFLNVVAGIRAAGFDPGVVHVANSGGIALHPSARVDMVRPGIMAYGYPPGDNGFENLDLRPVMELRSPISFIKQVPKGTPLSYGHRWTTEQDSWIGTVALGYADGLHRTASGRFAMTTVAPNPSQSRNFPQVGTICMDQCLVNLGPADQACPVERWDELVVFGPPHAITSAQTLALAAGTIPYEICCNISKRVPRIYSED